MKSLYEVFEMMRAISDDMAKKMSQELNDFKEALDDEELYEIVLDKFIIDCGGINKAKDTVDDCIKFYTDMDAKDLSNRDAMIYEYIKSLKPMYETVAKLIGGRLSKI